MGRLKIACPHVLFSDAQRAFASLTQPFPPGCGNRGNKKRNDTPSNAQIRNHSPSCLSDPRGALGFLCMDQNGLTGWFDSWSPGEGRRVRPSSGFLVWRPTSSACTWGSLGPVGTSNLVGWHKEEDTKDHQLQKADPG